MKSVTLMLIIAGAIVGAQGQILTKIATGSWSVPYEDDSVSKATCQEEEGYYMVQCSCMLKEMDRYAYRPCDGSVMTTDRFGYTVCVAYNQVYGGGVTARAQCAQLFVTVRSDENVRANPTTTCPAGYKMIGCNMHAYHSHQLRDETGAVSYAFEPDYDTHTCAARCPVGAHAKGDVIDGDITIVKDLSEDVNGCSTSAMCYWGDPSTIPVDELLPEAP